MHLREIDALAAGQNTRWAAAEWSSVGPHQAPTSKGSFLAPLRTRSRVQERKLSSSKWPPESCRSPKRMVLRTIASLYRLPS